MYLLAYYYAEEDSPGGWSRGSGWQKLMWALAGPVKVEKMLTIIPAAQLRRRYSLARPTFQFMLNRHTFISELRYRVMNSNMNLSLQEWIRNTMAYLPPSQPVRGVIWEVDGLPVFHVENLELEGQRSEDYMVFTYKGPEGIFDNKFTIAVCLAFICGFALGRATA